MKPTPEQVEAAKAYVRNTETPMQYALLRGSGKAIPPSRIAEILLAALEAAEADSARLDWLLDPSNERAEACVYSAVLDAEGWRIICDREAIDAARKAQP